MERREYIFFIRLLQITYSLKNQLLLVKGRLCFDAYVMQMYMVVKSILKARLAEVPMLYVSPAKEKAGHLFSCFLIRKAVDLPFQLK